MKKVIALMIMLMTLSGCFHVQNKEIKAPSPASDDKVEQKSGQSNEPFRRYGIESGIIESTKTGMTKGSQKIYFSDWGAKEANFDSTEITTPFGMQKTNMLTIMDGSTTYSINLDTKKGTKFRNEIYDKVRDNLDEADLEKIGEKLLRDLGAVESGTEMIAGKECKLFVTEKLGSTSCIWKGIAIKTEVKTLGQTLGIVANSIEENAAVADDIFQIPGDATITELGNFGDMFKDIPNPPL